MWILQVSLRRTGTETEELAEHSCKSGKNLISQNVYLKKSPVTLSYEKLLKFVHSIQGRNGMTGAVHTHHNTSKDNIVIGDNESIDAL